MYICVEGDGAIARKQQLRFQGDLRSYPRYSIDEAASYLNLPPSTLKSWVRGYTRTNKHGTKKKFDGVIRFADPERGLLSFLNLAEAYVLRFTRRKHVSLKRVRLAVEYISDQYHSDHPLLHPDLAAGGGSVFIRELGIPLNASSHGQFGIEEILAKHLAGIRRDSSGLPEELSPLHNRVVSINPLFSSGEPVIAGTGIMVSTLVSRHSAGDSPEEISQDYGIESRTIERAIKAYRPQAA